LLAEFKPLPPHTHDRCTNCHNKRDSSSGPMGGALTVDQQVGLVGYEGSFDAVSIDDDCLSFVAAAPLELS